MNNSEAFNKYQRIKKELEFNYKSYPLEKIMALDLIVEIYQNPKFRGKTLGYFFLSTNLKNLRFNDPRKTFFSMGEYGRTDYYEIWEYVKSQINNKHSFDFYPLSFKLNFNFKNIFNAFSVFSNTNALTISSKIKLAAKLTFYLNTISEIERIKPLAGKYCAFSSVHPMEAILTSYFKKKGVKTYSLQHGLTFVFKKQILHDAILYENFISDFHFCWGQYTRDELANYGVNPNALLIGGYPRKVVRPLLPNKLDGEKCLVLLARNAFHDTNLKLLNILKQYTKENNVKISLKLHPNLNRQLYQEIASENNWYLVEKQETITNLLSHGEFGWAIAVNTAAYYESYIYYLPCLRYNDGTFEDSVDILNDRFSNYDEFRDCLSQIPFDKTSDLKQYFETADKRLDYAIGINTNNYQHLRVEE